MNAHALHTTGNLWFALPRISAPPVGGLDRLAFLMMSHRGLIELSSGDETPFLSAEATVDGETAFSKDVIVQPLCDWIPVFGDCSKGYETTLTWLAPHDERGWICRVEIRNTGTQPLEAGFTYRLKWGHTSVSTYETERMSGHIELDPNSWCNAIALPWVTNRTEFALGLGLTNGGRMHLVMKDESGDVRWQGDPMALNDQRMAFEPGLTADVVCSHQESVAPGESASLDLCCSVSQDCTSVSFDTRYFREQGFEKLLDNTIRRLNGLNCELPERLAADPHLGPMVRRNRLFCYFYSLGRTLDTEEICPVTSRSSDYYVSAAYWDRDSLLWAFPTVLHADHEMAAEMIRTAFGRQGRNIGIHSRFIDGSMYEPGFELDELCAPIIALDQYVEASGDDGIFDTIPFDARLKRIEKILAQRQHPNIALYSTDYLPTDDLIVYPYCTYDNVLVWVVCGAMARIETLRGDLNSASRWSSLREEVAEAIRTHCVVEHEGERLFAWSVDLKGNYRLYDEPPGSLTLLAWYGFCSHTDPVFEGTLRWVYSTRNEHYFPEAEEIGCQHEPHPWILAVGNSLLLPSRREAAIKLLRQSDMDQGIACEAIDEQTGLVISGNHFATCAGFLCQGLLTAFSEKTVKECREVSLREEAQRHQNRVEASLPPTRMKKQLP